MKWKQTIMFRRLSREEVKPGMTAMLISENIENNSWASNAWINFFRGVELEVVRISDCGTRVEFDVPIDVCKLYGFPADETDYGTTCVLSGDTSWFEFQG